MRIAVLEDDPVDAQRICDALSAAGYVCRVFTEGRALVHQLRRQSFDLLLLDWSVPDMPARDVLARVRSEPRARLPFLLLIPPSTTRREAPPADVRGGERFAKPIEDGALRHRVDSMLRRAYRMRPGVLRERFGHFEFDLREKSVRVRGEAVALTLKEFELALALFRRLSRPLSRAHILDIIWKESAGMASRTMDTHVSVLRAKLGLRPENGYRLAPIYGFGYLLESTIDGAGHGGHGGIVQDAR